MPEAPQDSLDQARALSKVWSGLFGGGREAPRVDQYYLLEELGAGAMGVVYSAYDPDLQRHVALKLLHRDRAIGPTSTPRLLREARALAKVSHPNVVGVYAVGTGAEGGYIAMEYVQGQTLAEWLREGAHPWRDVLRRFIDAGNGLTAAHEVGIVHRDFKPANVLVGHDGVVRVADFGLAWENTTNLASESSSDPDRTTEHDRLTATGLRVGTPAYMAPEQRRGEDASAAADQFAFCVSVYEGLWGQRPRLDDKTGALAVDLGQAPPMADGRRAPTPLTRALQRGLARSPAKRFASLAILVRELESVLRPRHLRRTVPWAIASASLLGLVAMQTGSSVEVSTPPHPCATTTSELDEVWNEAQRAALTEHLSSTGHPGAARIDWVVPAVDKIAASWVADKLETCQAYHQGQESAALFDLRSECLERTKSTFAHTVELLTNERLPPMTIERTLAAFESSTTCNGSADLMHRRVRPTDPTDRAEGQLLLDRVAREFVRAEAELEPSEGAVAEIRFAAERSKDPAARGNAYRYLAGRTSDRQEQRRLQIAAIAEAINSRDVLLLVMGYAELAHTHAVKGEVALAYEALELAEAANTDLARQGPGYAPTVAWMSGSIHSKRADLARYTGDSSAALKAALKSAEAWEPYADTYPLLVANARNNIGEGLRLTGHPREALVQYDIALAFAAKRAAPKSFTLGTIHNNRGAALIEAGELTAGEAALGAGKEALQMVRDRPDLGLIEVNLGTIALLREQYPAAKTHFTAATNIFGGHGPDFRLFGLIAELGNAAIARELGDDGAALNALEGIAREFLDLVGPKDPRLAELLIERAQTLRSAGRLTAAYDDATAAVQMQADAGMEEGPERARYLVQLAEIELVTARKDEAETHVRRAITSIEAIGSPFHPYLAPANVLLAHIEFSRDPVSARRRLARASEIVQRHELGPKLRERIKTTAEELTDAR